MPQQDPPVLQLYNKYAENQVIPEDYGMEDFYAWIQNDFDANTKESYEKMVSTVPGDYSNYSLSDFRTWISQDKNLKNVSGPERAEKDEVEELKSKKREMDESYEKMLDKTVEAAEKVRPKTFLDKIPVVGNLVERNSKFYSKLMARYKGSYNKYRQDWLKEKVGSGKLNPEDYTPKQWGSAFFGEDFLSDVKKSSEAHSKESYAAELEEEGQEGLINLPKLVDKSDNNDHSLFAIREGILDKDLVNQLNFTPDEIIGITSFEEVKIPGKDITYADALTELGVSEHRQKELLLSAKNQIAGGETISRQAYQKIYHTYADNLNSKRTYFENVFRDSVGEEVWNDYQESLEVSRKIAEGEMSQEDLEENDLARYQTAIEQVQSQEGYGQFEKIIDRSQDLQDEYAVMPTRFKKAIIVEKMANDYQKDVDDKHRELAGVYKFLHHSEQFLKGTMERMIDDAAGLGTLARAKLGNEGSQAYLAYQAATSETDPNTQEFRSTKEKKSLHHYGYDYADEESGELYEFAYDSEGELIGIYDQDGYEADISEEKYTKLRELSEENEFYKDTELRRDNLALTSQALDVTGDVLATILFSKGTMVGTKITSKALSGAGKLGRIASKVHKSDRLNSLMAVTAQYSNRSTIEAIRSGSMSPEDAINYGVLSSALEGAVSAAYPLASKIARGRVMNKIMSYDKKQLIKFFKNYQSAGKEAMKKGLIDFVKGIGSEIIEEEVAEGVKNPALNHVFNKYMGTQFEADNMPTLQEAIDVAKLSSFASVGPSIMHGMQSGSYTKSTRALSDIMLKVADPKYKDAVIAQMDELLDKGKITEEEAEYFGKIYERVSGRVKEIRENDEARDTPERIDAKEELASLEIERAMLQEEETNSKRAEEKKIKKVDEVNDKIERLYRIIDSAELKRPDPSKTAKKIVREKEKERKKSQLKEERSLKNNFEDGEAASITGKGKYSLEKYGEVQVDEETGEYFFVSSEDGKKYSQEDLEEGGFTIYNSEGKAIRPRVDDFDIDTQDKITRTRKKWNDKKEKALKELAQEEADKGKSQAEIEKTLKNSDINKEFDDQMEEEIQAIKEDARESREEGDIVEEGEKTFESEGEAEESGAPIKNKDGKPTTPENKTKGKKKTYNLGGRKYTNTEGTDAIITDKDGNVTAVRVKREGSKEGAFSFIQGEGAQILADKILAEEVKARDSETKKEVDEKTKKAEAARERKSKDKDGDSKKGKKVSKVVGKLKGKRSKPKSIADKRAIVMPQIKKLNKAIKNFLPGLKIVVLDTPKEFQDYMKENFGQEYATGPKGSLGVAGAYGASEKTGRVIAINLSELRDNTLYHEGSHAILDVMSQIDPELVNKLYEDLINMAEKYTSVLKYIDYGKKTQSKEEAVVEFLADFLNGDLTPTEIGLDMTQVVEIIENIKKAIKKAIKNFLNSDYQVDDVDLRGLAAHLKNSIETGNDFFGGAVKAKKDPKITDKTVTAQRIIDVSTDEKTDAEFLKELYGKKEGEVTNNIMQRVFNNVADRMGYTYNQLRERLSIVKARVGETFTPDMLNGGLNNDLATDFTGAVTIKRQGNPLDKIAEVPQKIADNVEGLGDGSRKSLMLYKAMTLFPDIMSFVSKKKDFAVDSSLRQQINNKQKEIGALYKSGRGDEASDLKKEVKELKEKLKESESASYTREEVENLIDSKLMDIHRDVLDTDKYVLTQITDEFVESHLETARKRNDQRAIDAWEYVRDNEEARQRQTEHQKEVQRDILKRGFNYLLRNEGYPVAFKALLINEVLTKRTINIYDTNSDGTIKLDEEGEKIIIGTETNTRTNTTYAEPDYISSATAPDIYQGLMGGEDLSISELILKAHQKSFPEKKEIKSIATQYIHEKRPGGVWVKVPENGTERDVENLRVMTRDSHRTGGDWCTGSVADYTAKQHNEYGDFFIFFDNDWNARLAARFEGDTMGEPMRGLGSDQEVEASMNEEAEWFMDYEPRAEEYKKHLIFNRLYNKYKDGKELEEEDVPLLIENRDAGDGSYNHERSEEKESFILTLLQDNSVKVAKHLGITEEVKPGEISFENIHISDYSTDKELDNFEKVKYLLGKSLSISSDNLFFPNLKYFNGNLYVQGHNVDLSSLETTGGSGPSIVVEGNNVGLGSVTIASMVSIGGNSVSMPRLKSVTGTIEVGGLSYRTFTEQEFPSLRHSGNIIIGNRGIIAPKLYSSYNISIMHADGDIVMPALHTVRGKFKVVESTNNRGPIKIDFSNLHKVEGDMHFLEGNIEFPSLVEAESIDITIHAHNLKFPALKRVKERLLIQSKDSEFDSLEVVGDELTLDNPGATVNLPKLREVGRSTGGVKTSLDISTYNGDVGLSSLEYVRGGIHVGGEGAISLPSLKGVNGKVSVKGQSVDLSSLIFSDELKVILTEKTNHIEEAIFYKKEADFTKIGGIDLSSLSVLRGPALFYYEPGMGEAPASLSPHKPITKLNKHFQGSTEGSPGKEFIESYAVELVEPKDSDYDVLDQEGRAFIAINRDKEKYLIHLSKDSDVSSPLHEAAHLYEEVLTKSEKKDILDWAGHKKWTRSTSEKFAKGFEKYLYEGTTDKNAENVFKKFARYMKEVIDNAIKYFNGLSELNDDMIAIYDAMVEGDVRNAAKDAQIAGVDQKTDSSPTNLNKLLESVGTTMEQIRSKLSKDSNTNPDSAKGILNTLKNTDATAKQKRSVIKELSSQKGKGLLDSGSFC